MASKTFNDVKINVRFDQATSDVTVEGGNNHASNIDGSTAQDLALGLGKIQNWYNNWNSVVWTGNAAKVNGLTVQTAVPANAVFTDTKVTQNVNSDDTGKMYPLLFSNYTTSQSTTTAAVVSRKATIYATPKDGSITANNFIGNINGFEIGMSVPAGSKLTDTTYTFTGDSSSAAYFEVTPLGGSKQTVRIKGLGTMAFETASNYVATSMIGAANGVAGLDQDGLIPSSQLPSYVDDVIEFWKENNKFYEVDPETHTKKTPAVEITTGEYSKIYVDINATPAETYRWTGSAFASMKSPSVKAVNSITAGSATGKINIGFTDGTSTTDFVVYAHPTTAGNKHIPTGGATGNVLTYNGSSGTAKWQALTGSGGLIADYTGPTSSAAGVHGLVPGGATYANREIAFLRADGSWSTDPVIPADTLTLNVVAGTA